MGHVGRYRRGTPKITRDKANHESLVILGQKERLQSKVTRLIQDTAKRFPNNDLPEIKRIADFVFESTPVKDTVYDKRKRFSMTASEILKRGHVDLLHCIDRCHLMTSILTAKGINSWLVVEYDWQGYIHTYVEMMLKNLLHTISFRVFEPPFIKQGRVEETVKHSPGSRFVRGLDMGQFGVIDGTTYQDFVERMKQGKVKGKIILPPNFK